MLLWSRVRGAGLSMSCAGKFLMVDPDHGGFNNIRLAFEAPSSPLVHAQLMRTARAESVYGVRLKSFWRC